jgi:hypothetical protein
MPKKEQINMSPIGTENEIHSVTIPIQNFGLDNQ